MSSPEDPGSKYFSKKATSRDRAVFEAGIAVGTIIHQFTGVPLKTKEDAELLAEVIRRAVLAQPYRVEADVKVEFEKPERPPPYDYTTLKSSNIDARVVVKYNNVRVVARVRYIPEIGYTLGYIEDIEEL